MDPNASLLSDLGSRAPRFGTNTMNQFSPITSQVATPTQDTTLPGFNLSTPPRLDTSGISGVTEVGRDLLDDHGAMTSSASVVGTIIDAPSPRPNAQSPETHQLQQTLRDSASEQVRMYSSTNDSGDGASAFSTLHANNTSTIVETIQEGGSDYGQEGVDLNNDVQVDLSARLSNAPNDADSVYESGLHGLVIDTKDLGQANFVMGVRALGNASGTPLDGLQDMSFGERTVDVKFTVDGDKDDTESSVTGHNVPSGHDPNVITDLAVIVALMTQLSVTDPQSPTVQFNEQVTVTKYPPDGAMFTFDAVPSTSAENMGSMETSSPTQGDSPSSQPEGNANTGGNPNSNDSNGNDGNEGGTSNDNDPQCPVADRNYLDKLVFSYCARGGQSLTWGIKGRIRVADVVRMVGPESSLSVQSIRRLLQPDLVDRVTTNTHFTYQHNDRQRVRAIINGMSLFMLTAPTLVHAPGNFTMLGDYVQSSEEICTLLVRHLEYADTLPQDQLPLEVPLLFFGERMQMHQCGITGTFEYMKCVDDANTVMITYGLDANGVQIVDPVVMQPLVLPPVQSVQVNKPPVPGGAPPVALVPGNVQDPNAVLIQGVLAAIQAMTQVNLQSDM